MYKLWQTLQKSKKLVIGLMSGTSVDGIDCALVEIEGSGLETKAELLGFFTYPFLPALRAHILYCCSDEGAGVEDICRLNFRLGVLFAEAVQDLCQKLKVPIKDIDLIGSHGQTVFHVPQHSTLQIGEPCVIAEMTGIPVVADFRMRDVAAGGHGAPLVPYTEYLLFRSEEKSRILQNIGGIANATYLPASCRLSDVMAFDTGPGNMLIDHLVQRLTGGQQMFDRDGTLAGQGRVCQDLLDGLMGHPFFRQAPPKSTGRELFGHQFADLVLKDAQEKGLAPQDIMATVTAFTARSIAQSYRRFFCLATVDEVFVSGGGGFNKTLMSMLRTELAPLPVWGFQQVGLNAEAKEAMAFAILANETIHGHCNNLPYVTGAGDRVVLGKIIPA